MLNWLESVSPNPHEPVSPLGGQQLVLADDSPLRGIAAGAIHDIDSDDYARYITSTKLLSRALGISAGSNAIIINGRVSVSLS